MGSISPRQQSLRGNVVIFKVGIAFGIENAGQISMAGMNNLLSSRDKLEYWADKPSVVCIQHYHSIATNMRCRSSDYVMKINVWSTYGSSDVIEVLSSGQLPNQSLFLFTTTRHEFDLRAPYRLLKPCCSRLHVAHSVLLSLKVTDLIRLSDLSRSVYRCSPHYPC